MATYTTLYFEDFEGAPRTYGVAGYGAGYGCTVALDDTDSHSSGTSCLLVTDTAEFSGIDYYSEGYLYGARVSDAQHARVSFYYKEATATMHDGWFWRIYWEHENADGTFSRVAEDMNVDIPMPRVTEWTLADSGTVDVPAEADLLIWELLDSGATETGFSFRVDDILAEQVEEISDPEPDPEPVVGPLAAYSFDGTGDLVVDETGNGHDFSLAESSTTRIAGHTGTALTQTGGTMATVATSPFGQTPQRTIAMWFQGDAEVWRVRWQVTAINSGAWGLLNLGGSIGVWARDTTASYRASAPTPTDGLWHHHAGTFDGSTLRFYLDGVETASTSMPEPIRTDADYLDIMENLNGIGVMDDLRIYDRALTPTEIATAMNTPVGTSPEGSMQYFDGTSWVIVTPQYYDGTTWVATSAIPQ